MHIMNRTSPSRQGKKQVIAFLLPGQGRAVYAKAAAENKTNQEIIGEAINAVFRAHGMEPPVKLGHHRIVRRKNGKAKIREEGNSPGCRTGRHSLSGWFDADTKRHIDTFSSEQDLPIQAIIESGIEMITGVAATVEDDATDVKEAPANAALPASAPIADGASA